MKMTQAKTWKRQLQKRQKEVGAIRDAIRDDLSDMEGLKETCDIAYDDMQRAIDALSELA